MLVLTRKTQQQIQIGDQITITVMRIKGQSVRIGIDAPKEVRVMRSELPDARQPAESPNDNGPTATGVAIKACLPIASPTAETSPAAKGESNPSDAAPCSGPVTTMCRTPGASRAPLMRRAQRLGPSSLRSFARRF
jgi:carbon storage regulator CsrA